MGGGFPFELATEIAKNKVELITFEVPVHYLHPDDGEYDGLNEDEISFSFPGMGNAPFVIGVNDDWAAQVLEETGMKIGPNRLDRLQFMGGKNASQMSKPE